MKNITLVVLVLLLLVVGGLVVLNKDRFKGPLQTEENKTTQTVLYGTPSPTQVTPTPSTSTSVDLNTEINNLDKTLNDVDPNDLNGSDLSNTAVGAQ